MPSSRKLSSGFAYVILLLIVALSAAMLAAIGEVWETTARRAKETELLFIGRQFQAALASYEAASPGAPVPPKSLEELVEDRRLPKPRRHLRKIFVDPMTSTAQWGLKRDAEGRIRGVFSLSRLRPFAATGFAPGEEEFEKASTYSDWLFAVIRMDGKPGSGTQGAPAATAATQGAQRPSQAPAQAVEDPRLLEQRAAQLKEWCESEAASEMMVCTSTVASLGADAFAKCEASVQARAAICASGSGQLPPPIFDGSSLRKREAGKS